VTDGCLSPLRLMRTNLERCLIQHTLRANCNCAVKSVFALKENLLRLYPRVSRRNHPLSTMKTALFPKTVMIKLPVNVFRSAENKSLIKAFLNKANCKRKFLA